MRCLVLIRVLQCLVIALQVKDAILGDFITRGERHRLRIQEAVSILAALVCHYRQAVWIAHIGMKGGQEALFLVHFIHGVSPHLTAHVG